eukprot:5138560-Pleurochrysis_carterae.AAC.1
MWRSLSPGVRSFALPLAHSPSCPPALRGLRHSHALPCACFWRPHVWFCSASHDSGAGAFPAHRGRARTALLDALAIPVTALDAGAAPFLVATAGQAAVAVAP